MVHLDAARMLDQSTTVADLVPIDAEAVSAVARRLRSVGGTLDAIARELNALVEAPDWLGDAGRAFERRVADCPDHVRRGACVFGASTDAFTELSQAIADALPDVVASFNLWQLAREQSRRWHAEINDAFRRGTPSTGIAADDPGLTTAGRAITLYADARARMEEATARAMRTLELATEAAPGIGDFIEGPGAVESALGFGAGVGDFTRESAGFLYDFNAIRLAFDPDGLFDDIDEVAAGLGHLHRHPGDIDDVLFDLELLRDDPARWLGKLLAPTILLAPLSRLPSLTIDTTARVAGRLGRPGRFVHRHLDDLEQLDRIATTLGLPGPGTLAKLGDPAVIQQALDSARRVEPRDDDQADRLAEQHGGKAADYQRKVTDVPLEGGHHLTLEFVHNTETNEVFEPRVVTGEVPERCGS